LSELSQAIRGIRLCGPPVMRCCRAGERHGGAGVVARPAAAEASSRVLRAAGWAGWMSRMTRGAIARLVAAHAARTWPAPKMSASAAPAPPPAGRVLTPRHGDHMIRRARQLVQTLPVPLHHASPHCRIVPFQCRHQHHRLSEPAGLPPRRAHVAGHVPHPQSGVTAHDEQAPHSPSQQTYRHRLLRAARLTGATPDQT
jgi:hypothetical protein